MKNTTDCLVKKLERQVKELALDVKAITDEHDSYLVSNNWLERFPIETLMESLNREHGLPRTHVTIKDMNHRLGLRKLYAETMQKFEQAQSDLRVAVINSLLNKIEKVENKDG